MGTDAQATEVPDQAGARVAALDLTISFILDSSPTGASSDWSWNRQRSRSQPASRHPRGQGAAIAHKDRPPPPTM